MRARRTLISVVLFTILLFFLNTIVYAISSSDINISSPQYGYYLNDSYVSYNVSISGASNNPATVKVYYPYYVHPSYGSLFLKTLSRVGTTYTYTGSSIPGYYSWSPGRKPGSHSSWDTRGFSIQATKDGTTVSSNASGYITYGSQSFYTSTDSTFSYVNTITNSFYGVGTPNPSIDSLTYNCLSYVIAINTNWQWPWTGNPTLSELDDYMSITGTYSSRPGKALYPSSLSACDVIYYSDNNWGVGNDGHFAKVVAWAADGFPAAIMSKWGTLELIKSTSYNPFISGSGYGAPKRYYKYYTSP